MAVDDDFLMLLLAEAIESTLLRFSQLGLRSQGSHGKGQAEDE